MQEGTASIEVPNDGSEDSLLWRDDTYFHKYDKEKEEELILKLSERISILTEEISDDFKDEVWYKNLIERLSDLDLDDFKLK